MNAKIRMAEGKDIEEILGIYVPYIKDSTITFEYEVPTMEEFKKRFYNVKENYPYLVCTIDNKVVGYAYSSRHAERAAYMWDVDFSIYINDSYLRYGIGKAFYTSLIEISKLQNIKNVYGGVTENNIKSEKLHEYFGFKKAGVFHKTGYKFGKWLDVIWYEKDINESDEAPKPIISIKDINSRDLQNILTNAEKLIRTI